MTNHEQLWYLGYNYLRNVVNCWIKLLITIHMCYLGYNYLRNVVNCWIKLLITIQMWYNYLRNIVTTLHLEEETREVELLDRPPASVDATGS